MKTFIKIVFSLLIISSFLYSQSRDTSKTALEDSSKIKNKINFLNEIQFKFDEFELHRELFNIKLNLVLDEDPKTVWLRTSILISQTKNSPAESPNYLLSPLYNRYMESSKFNPIRYVLGMAQAGAAGYLAYKHIKKYGFK